MKTRQVQFMEQVKLGTTTFNGPDLEAGTEGDVHTFPEEEANEYIGLGWCRCTVTGEIGERKEGAQKLKVQSTRQELGQG